MPIAAALIAASLAMQPTAPIAIHRDVPDVKVSAGHVDRLTIIGETGFGDTPTVWVWRPPSYEQSPKRAYPVLYMHDGQNLFDASLTNYGKEWGMDEAITRMAARGDLREWIVVGIRSPEQRYLALFPEQVARFLSPTMIQSFSGVAGVKRIGKNGFKGDEYLKWLVGRVKPAVDQHYRTLPGPEDTAVMGSSMGGLMSLYALTEYPEIFGQAAAISIHLPLGDPEKTSDADRYRANVMAAWAAYLRTSKLDPSKNRLYMDYGTATLDRHYAPYFADFDAMIAAAGWTGPTYETRRFTGAAHDEDAWRERIDIPLAFLDRKDP